jgi:hypothetical protein
MIHTDAEEITYHFFLAVGKGLQGTLDLGFQ